MVAAICLSLFPAVAPAYDLRFDYTSFGSGFGQSQFDVLNYASINGSYMMTSTDNHRPEMVANGNALAEFYNFLTDRYTEQTVKDGAAAADAINQYTVSNSTNNGPRPNWLILNEISPSLWSANPGSRLPAARPRGSRERPGPRKTRVSSFASGAAWAG